MIVRMVARGRSFTKLAAYLTQPKEGQHRALWHSVENVGCTDPRTAAKIMAATDLNADALKAAAGIGNGGRKSKDGSVYHVVMSWAEGQQPDQAHQLQAARDMLQTVGLDRAQALVVAHNDNGKEHVHIMVNLVDPDNGKRLSLSNDRHKMQEWALAYERQNGGVIIERRAEKAEAWAKGEPQAKGESIPRPALDKAACAQRKDWQQIRAERDAAMARQRDERGAMFADHKAQWTDIKREAAAHKAAYKAAFRAAYGVAKAEDKAANKPLWRDTFKRQTAERTGIEHQLGNVRQQADRARQIATKAARATVTAERRSASIIGKAAQAIGLAATPAQAQARQIAAAQQMERAALELARAELAKAGLKAKHDAERASLAKALGEVTFAKAQLAVDTMPRADFAAMIAKQDEQRAAMIEHHNAERASLGIKPYEPRTTGAPIMTPEERLNPAKAATAGKVSHGFNPPADRRQTREPPEPSIVQGASRVPTPSFMGTGTTPTATDKQKIEQREAAAAAKQARTSFAGYEASPRRAGDKKPSPYEAGKAIANSPEEKAKRAAAAFKSAQEKGRDDFEL